MLLANVSSYALGLVFIVLVAVIWSIASIVVQYLYAQSFDAPFLLTYIGTSLFVVQLPLHWLYKRWEIWRSSCGDRSNSDYETIPPRDETLPENWDEEGERQESLSIDFDNQSSNINNNNNNNNNNVRVPVPNRPSVAHVPAQQQQQPEPSSPPFSSRTSPGSTPRATPGNSYRVGGLQIAPRSPNGHNASLTHEILSSFQRATANSYRNSNNHNHNYANNNGNNEPDQQRQIPSLHDLNRNGTTGSFGGEQDGDNQRHINYTPAAVIDVNSETTQYLF
mmetsp:Transcript_26145/g.54776  ORF Transcript_26145/g.54776 Transcript_26145/m.54776 type:complete len:279 (-) Transcript_26145:80-916(-)